MGPQLSGLLYKIATCSPPISCPFNRFLVAAKLTSSSHYRAMLLLLLHSFLFSTTLAGLVPSMSDSKKPQSVMDCDLSKCHEKEGLMCLCERVAWASVHNAGAGFTSTDAGEDNVPYPGYLRTNYGNSLQKYPSSTICHGMVLSKSIDAKKCLVSCSIMEQYIRAGSGQDAMVCQKAVEEAGIVMDGNILGEEKDSGIGSGTSGTSLRL